MLVDLAIGSPAIYAHWTGDLQAMHADNLLVPHSTLAGVYVETVRDYSTNQPVLDANGQPMARPFGEQMNGGGELVDERGQVILDVPNLPLNIDQGPLNGWFTLFGTQLVEGKRAAPIGVSSANQTGLAFLLDIGLGPLDANFIAGDGRVNENNGLTVFTPSFTTYRISWFSSRRRWLSMLPSMVISTH